MFSLKQIEEVLKKNDMEDNKRNRIFTLCEQYNTLPYYNSIIELSMVLLKMSHDKESFIKGLEELTIEIWPGQPDKLLRNLHWDIVYQGVD